MDMDTGAVVPPNFVPNRFVHFTCDNIDINDSSSDGTAVIDVIVLSAIQQLKSLDGREVQKQTWD